MVLDTGVAQRGSVVLVRLPRDKARSDLLAELSHATMQNILRITIDLRRRASCGPTSRPANGAMRGIPGGGGLAAGGSPHCGGCVIDRLDATMQTITRQMTVAAAH
jgi:hypothetical protein